MAEKEKDETEDHEGCGWRTSSTEPKVNLDQKSGQPQTPPANMTGWDHPELKD